LALESSELEAIGDAVAEAGDGYWNAVAQTKNSTTGIANDRNERRRIRDPPKSPRARLTLCARPDATPIRFGVKMRALFAETSFVEIRSISIEELMGV